MADHNQESGAGSRSETTPLLATESGTHGSSVQEQPRTPVRDHNVVIGSWASASVAMASIGLWLAVSIMRQREPRFYVIMWDVREALNPLAAMALVATLCSIFNLVQLYQKDTPLPLTINVIVDIIIGCFVTGLAGSSVGGASSGGFCHDYDSTPPELEKCERWKLLFGPVLLAFIIATLLLGVIHILLLIYRVVKVYQARDSLAAQVNRWTIPTGQLTFEFSIKLLRQPQDTSHHDPNLQTPTPTREV